MDGDGPASAGAGGPQADGHRRRIRTVVTIVAVALLAFGAGAVVAVLANDDEPAVAQSPTASITGKATGSPSESTGSQEPSRSASAEPSQEPTPVGDVLPDGRHFVQVDQVVDLGSGRAVRFDLAYFLEDEAAQEAAGDHGDEAPNGYYIVNDDPKPRTAPIASDAKVTYVSVARCCNTVKGDLDAWADSMNGMVQSDYPPADSTWWWLTVHGGRVTAIDQQYLP